MADQLNCSNIEPHDFHGWEERVESAPLGWHFHVCAGVLPTFRGSFEITEAGPGLQTLIDHATQLEAERRESAVSSAVKAGVGVRVDVFAFRTEYRLDPSVPAGTIEEHSHAHE